MDRSTAIEIALIKDKTTPAQRLLAREFLEMEFALTLSNGLFSTVFDSQVSPKTIMEVLRACPDSIWNLSRDVINHKYPKLYWDDAKCDKQEADLLRDELNGK